MRRHLPLARPLHAILPIAPVFPFRGRSLDRLHRELGGSSRSGPPEGPSAIHSLLSDEGYVGIPTRKLRSGHYQAMVQADGHRLFLIVDSGASTSVLDNGSAVRLGVRLRRSRARVSGLGAPAQRALSATLEDVRIGALRLDSLAVVVLDLSHVNQSLQDEGIGLADGVIGADVLAQRRAVFDFTSGVLYLR